MKRISSLMLIALTIGIAAQAQFKNILKKDSSGKSGISKILQKATSKPSLSNDEIASGLKEALNVGTNNASQKLSGVDGFFKDAAVKILMPEEAKKAETKLRKLGLGKLVDDAILSMNRAAEDASKSAAPIFINAIKQMSIQDAVGILKGLNCICTERVCQLHLFRSTKNC